MSTKQSEWNLKDRWERINKMDHQLTFSSTAVENIPIVKRPNKGPPTTPKIVREACRTPPRYSAKKAMARLMAPKAKATSWVIQAKRESDVFLKKMGCKSEKKNSNSVRKNYHKNMTCCVWKFLGIRKNPFKLVGMYLKNRRIHCKILSYGSPKCETSRYLPLYMFSRYFKDSLGSHGNVC